MKKAKFFKKIITTDPATNESVEISLYKHENGRFFGIDSNFLQIYDLPVIQDIFEEEGNIILIQSLIN